jgi:hypothetical protein
MLDLFTELQKAIAGIDPAILGIAGIVGLVVGAAVWLIGVKITRVTAAILGFLIGAAIATSFSSPDDVIVVIAAAVVGAIVAMFIHKPVMIVNGLAAFTIITLTYLIAIHSGNEITNTYHSHAFEDVTTRLTTVESLQHVKIHLIETGDRLVLLSQNLLQKNWRLFAPVPLVLLLLAIFWGRFVFALACSSLGVAIISVSMTCLLLYKGSAPLTHAYLDPTYFFVVFLAMVATGTTTQLLLCKPPKQETSENIKWRQKEPQEYKSN